MRENTKMIRKMAKDILYGLLVTSTEEIIRMMKEKVKVK
jgi:hypothetical protein